MSSHPTPFRSLVTVWFSLFCDYALMTIPISIFPQLNASPSSTGLLFSTKAILQVISSPVVARLVDGYNLEPLILGLGIEVVSTFLYTLKEDYYLWAVARGISGLASSMIISSGFLHVQRVYRQGAEMGSAMSNVATGIILGVTAGPPMGGLLYGWGRVVPFVTMILMLTIAMSMAFRLQVSKYGGFKGFGEGRGGGMKGGGEHVELKQDDYEVEGGEGGEVPPPSSSSSTLPVSFVVRLKSLLSDVSITSTLFSLFCANASISCLESTFGIYMGTTFGYTVEQVGMLYVLGALPSVIGSKVAGGWGNRYGRWRIVLIGMLTQGLFFALGPKDNFGVEIVSLLGLGFGMGLVDGCAPALLAQVTDLRHEGTGVVYTVQTVAIQMGFIIGPILGGAIMQSKGFGFMSGLLGVFMVITAPILIVNRNLPEVGEEEGEEGGDGGGGREVEEDDILFEMKAKESNGEFV